MNKVVLTSYNVKMTLLDVRVLTGYEKLLILPHSVFLGSCKTQPTVSIFLQNSKYGSSFSYCHRRLKLH